LRQPQFYFKDRSVVTWVLFFCLLCPFLFELIVQLLREEIVPRSLDGPSRWVLFSGVFLCISRYDCSPILRALVAGSGVGIILVILSLLLFPGQYWSSRAATYFVDPITLPVYTVAMLATVLFGFKKTDLPYHLETIVKMILTLCVLYIAVESASRTAWLGLIGLLFCYFLFIFRGHLFKQFLATLVILSCALVSYQASNAISSRIQRGVEGIYQFFSSDQTQNIDLVRSTSTGQRLVIIEIDVELLKQSPVLGVADGVLPPFDRLAQKIPAMNEEIYFIRRNAGAHSEFMAVLVKQGIVFGLGTLALVFCLPIYLGLSRRSELLRTNFDSAAILGVILVLITTAFGIQVFNLKMTISFYIYCLVCMYAHIAFTCDKKLGRERNLA
jgi:hypothetical protein